MFDQYSFTAAERFCRYVQCDTQSDPHSTGFPSTEKQKALSRLLVEELLQIGITDAHLDDQGYVYATIPATTTRSAPVICLCAHVDTAPDCSGTDVRPLIHYKYQGSDIVLPDDPAQVIRMAEYPYLKNCLGKDVITASGKTLLGSDDKAGVAEIMDLANFLMKHPEVEHGPVRILFTPDEEVGRGVDHVDIEKLGADFGYTLDGGEPGSIEQENFSADGVTITLYGVSAHPGYAKGKMINALKLAGEVLALLPRDLSPEATSDLEGFMHPSQVSGIAEKSTLDFIIRDFITEKLAEKEALLRSLVESVISRHPGARFTFEVRVQYRNMKDVLYKHPQVVAYAMEAMRRAGLTPLPGSIRGGTDGSRLSFMGLPCPNLFAGQQAIHSKHEFICAQDMNKAVETLVYLVQIAAENQ
ncbi:MAG: peptidase T [Bacteroidetes bacterium]|nr:peptidase T [Bacteroidota bacterium]